MEIEVDGKALLRWLVGIVVVAGLLFVLSNGGGSTAVRVVRGLLHKGESIAAGHNAPSADHSTPTVQSAAGGTAPEPGPTPVTYSVPGRPTLVFEDLSSKWDWTVNEQCLPKLLDWLREDKWIKGHHFEKLTIGLVDEKAPEQLRPGPKGQEYELLYGAALPEHAQGGNYDYGAVAGCYMAKDEQAEDTGIEKCYVAPKIWKTDYDELSVTVVAAIVSAIEENLRPQTLDAWREYSDRWSIANYVPLIRKEGSKWHTGCLQVKPQR